MGAIPSKEEWFRALAKKQGEALQKRIADTSVAVCGCGGLGSNIAVTLARAGIGRLILIDFDTVDITNLHRQQFKANQIGLAKAAALKENLAEIAPYTAVTAHTRRLDESNIVALTGGADIICEAFDKAENKAALVNTVLTELPDTWLVAAAGMAGDGPANDIVTRRVTKRFYLCGDGVSDIGDGLCLLPSRVQLCAAHQAHAVLRIIAGAYDC